ncbi:DUF4249 domain-containing protein [Spirosoma gilvum]
MRNNRHRYWLGWILLLLVSGCIDPYRPPEIAAPASYLVVNGFFDSAPGATTTIQLSRTQNLTDTKSPTAETKAQVSIESQSKAVYTLKEGTAGAYSLSGVTPLTGETYRLHIKTSKGTDYYSDYVPVLTTPAIDSVSWHTEGNDVLFSVNTHDPKNNTRYYRWEFEETWEFTAPYYSQLELKNNQIVNRTEDINRCWNTTYSTNIMLTSTERLSQDIVSQFPLTSVAGTSGKLGIKYSLLVKSYALTQAGYAYYDQLAKITQNLGSIFDPQPSQITGNIRASTNPDDLVMGFFRVGTVASKRIFIRRDQLPTITTYAGDPGCVVDTFSVSKVLKEQPAIISLFGENQYLVTSFACVDCRYKGVNKRPSFWE